MAGTSYRELVEDALESLSDRRDRILELAKQPDPEPEGDAVERVLGKVDRRDALEEALLAEGTGLVLDLARVIGYGALAIAEG